MVRDSDDVFKNYITHFILSERIIKVGVVESGSSGCKKIVVASFGE